MKVGTDHIIKGSECPSCKKMLDGASAIDDDCEPSPGNVTICIYCGHIMAFADDLSFRELNDEEIRAVAGDKRILAVQRAREAKNAP
jgi:Zn ribbon nucleic-acid-binding protein